MLFQSPTTHEHLLKPQWLHLAGLYACRLQVVKLCALHLQTSLGPRSPLKSSSERWMNLDASISLSTMLASHGMEWVARMSDLVLIMCRLHTGGVRGMWADKLCGHGVECVALMS